MPPEPSAPPAPTRGGEPVQGEAGEVKQSVLAKPTPAKPLSKGEKYRAKESLTDEQYDAKVEEFEELMGLVVGGGVGKAATMGPKIVAALEKLLVKLPAKGPLRDLIEGLKGFNAGEVVDNKHWQAILKLENFFKNPGSKKLIKEALQVSALGLASASAGTVTADLIMDKVLGGDIAGLGEGVTPELLEIPKLAEALLPGHRDLGISDVNAITADNIMQAYEAGHFKSSPTDPRTPAKQFADALQLWSRIHPGETIPIPTTPQALAMYNQLKAGGSSLAKLFGDTGAQAPTKPTTQQISDYNKNLDATIDTLTIMPTDLAGFPLWEQIWNNLTPPAGIRENPNGDFTYGDGEPVSDPDTIHAVERYKGLKERRTVWLKAATDNLANKTKMGNDLEQARRESELFKKQMESSDIDSAAEAAAKLDLATTKLREKESDSVYLDMILKVSTDPNALIRLKRSGMLDKVSKILGITLSAPDKASQADMLKLLPSFTQLRNMSDAERADAIAKAAALAGWTTEELIALLQEESGAPGSPSRGQATTRTIAQE